MLEASPKHFFSNDFIIRSSGREVALLDIAAWRERAEFELAGVPYRMYREGLMSGAFVLERAGSIVAQAIKPSAFRTQFELRIGGESFTYRKMSFFSRSFGIFSADRLVGVVRPAHLFRRSTLLELPDAWSPAVQVFVFWLALVIWKREAAAAAS